MESAFCGGRDCMMDGGEASMEEAEEIRIACGDKEEAPERYVQYMDAYPSSWYGISTK